MLAIMEAVKSISQETVGTNEAMQGQSRGSDQLVGFTELMIQRGSLQQESFYYSVMSVMMQMYQSIAERGKKIYYDNEEVLISYVGDELSRVIRLSEMPGIRREKFRVYVKKSTIDEIQINSNNQILLQLYQLGLIDRRTISDYWGRATGDDIARALRRSYKDGIEVARRQKEMADSAAAAAQEESAAMMEFAERERMREEMNAGAEAEKDRQHEMDKIILKESLQKQNKNQ